MWLLYVIEHIVRIADYRDSSLHDSDSNIADSD